MPRPRRTRFEQLSKEGISTRMQEDQIRTAAEVAGAIGPGRRSCARKHPRFAGKRALRSRAGEAESQLTRRSRRRFPAEPATCCCIPGTWCRRMATQPLVVINQIAPIYVTFGVPERYLGAISARQNSQRKLAVEVRPGRRCRADARNSRGHRQHGRFRQPEPSG